MTPDGSILVGTEGQDSVKWIMQPAVANEPRQFTAVRFSTALQSSGVPAIELSDCKHPVDGIWS